MVAVSGEIDMATAPELRRALERAIPDTEQGLVIDLLDVSFMDSSGLGVLVAIRQGHPDLEMSIVTDQGMVERLLATTAMEQLFTIVRSVSELAP